MATRTVRRDGGGNEGRRKVRRSDGRREGQGELRRGRRTPPENHPLRESAEGHPGLRVPRPPENPAQHVVRNLRGGRPRARPPVVARAQRDATCPYSKRT